MANINDYLEWRGDLSFNIAPFNAVDNLILAELTYMDFSSLVPEQGIGLNQLAQAYQNCGRHDPSWPERNRQVELIRTSKRFSEVRAYHFVNRLTESDPSQFAAITYSLPDGTLYAAFRGTDNTIAGWHEDFNLAVESETPGQSEAVRYLNEVGNTAGRILVGGHSKGGNFAVYAALNCNPEVKQHIAVVYDNDGPGFQKAVVESPEYQDIKGRIVRLLPESSVIGILLANDLPENVIQSNEKGVMQHDPFSWEVLCDHFVQVKQRSNSSQFWQEALNGWIDAMSPQEKKEFVNVVFTTANAGGNSHTTFREIRQEGIPAYSRIMRAIKDMPAEKKKVMMDCLKKLADSSGVAVKDGIRELLNEKTGGQGS